MTENTGRMLRRRHGLLTAGRVGGERGPMARLLVLYGTPKDPAAFDAYYASTHVPIAKKIPGLRRYEASRGPVLTPSGPAPRNGRSKGCGDSRFPPSGWSNGGIRLRVRPRSRATVCTRDRRPTLRRPGHGGHEVGLDLDDAAGRHHA